MITIKAGWLVNPGKEPVKNPIIEIENGVIKQVRTLDKNIFNHKEQIFCHPEPFVSLEGKLSEGSKLDSTVAEPVLSVAEGLLQNDRVLDLEDSIILPGLVNSHCHLDYSFLKNKTPAGNFVEWLKFVIKVKNKKNDVKAQHTAPIPRHPDSTPRHPERSEGSPSQNAVSEAVNNGITAFGDIYTNGSGLTSLKKVPGLKGIVFIEFIDPEGLLTDESIIKKISLIKRKLKGTNIKIGIMAHAVYSVSPQSIKKLHNIAISKNIPFAIHIAESIEESVLVKYGNGPLANLVKKNEFFAKGLSPVGYLNKIDCLNGTILVHAVNLETSDYDIIAKNKNDIVLCPLSNRFLNVGVADYYLLKKAAGRISLATDSLASNDSLDLFAEARAAAQDYNLDYNECLRMITDYPGSVMGINALIEKGNQAHLAVIKPNKEIKDKADLLRVVFEDSKCVLTVAGGEIISSENSMHKNRI